MQVIVEGLSELRAAAERLDPTLVRSLDEALTEAGRISAAAVESTAPRRSGRLVGSVRAYVEGSEAGASVDARRTSPRYPGGYPYPGKVDRVRPFMAPAQQKAAPKIAERFQGVLDDIARAWGG